MNKSYKSIAAIDCPALLHSQGEAQWGNRAFASRFGIHPTPLKHLRIKELLWSLGVQDPLVGMIADGVTFDQCVAPGLGSAMPALYLRQFPPPGLPAQETSRILLIAESPDGVQSVDLSIGDMGVNPG
ncbi:MAG TPA: hypothetical protein HPP80_04370 [Rhodospirillaceae bacterium]|nr:hypothetical protein [Rhodospirillaceae bacterium]